MKKHNYLFILIAFLNITLLSLECKADTIVWSGNIELNGDMVFNQQQTLKVLPGTIVTATGAYSIEIRGNILAEGTADNPILFSANDTLGLYDSATIAGGWHGIHILNNENGYARFAHCRFEYGKANIPGSWSGSSQGFIDTRSGNQGGAIRIVNFNNIVFENCVFFYNVARTSGGAIYCDSIQQIKITDCDFLQNKSEYRGGAICCYNHDSLLISETTFRQNMAFRNSGGGGAIYLSNMYGISINVINSNTFFNNSSLCALTLYVSNLLLYNNLLTNNFNLYSIYLGLVNNSSQVFNNTIANNYSYGGIPGIFAASKDMNIYNNILWNNFSDYLEHDDLAIDWYYRQPDVFYNLVWDGRAEGEHIITDDPLFVNPAPGFGLDYNGWEYDWSLSDSSAAVNTGTPDTTGLNLPEFDIADNTRIYGTRIDMGAYENQFVWLKINDSPIFNKTVKVYPNPSRKNLYIALQPGMEGAWIELVDGTGKQVIHSQITSTPTMFSPIDLKAGIFFYRIYNKEQIFKTGKWIKL